MSGLSHCRNGHLSVSLHNAQMSRIESHVSQAYAHLSIHNNGLSNHKYQNIYFTHSSRNSRYPSSTRVMWPTCQCLIALPIEHIYALETWHQQRAQGINIPPSSPKSLEFFCPSGQEPIHSFLWLLGLSLLYKCLVYNLYHLSVCLSVFKVVILQCTCACSCLAMAPGHSQNFHSQSPSPSSQSCLSTSGKTNSASSYCSVKGSSRTSEVPSMGLSNPQSSTILKR